MSMVGVKLNKQGWEATKCRSQGRGARKRRLKKGDAGQLAGRIVCDVPPDRADFLTAQLKQLGNVIRLESTRRQSSDAGNPTAAATAKVEQKDTRFLITMYNLANIAPRQTNVMTIAVKDVAETYRTILEAPSAKPRRRPAPPSSPSTTPSRSTSPRRAGRSPNPPGPSSTPPSKASVRIK